MLLEEVLNIRFNDVNVSARRYYIYYTVIFILLLPLIYFVFIYYGKSFILSGPDGGADGLVQHYNSFVYYGKAIRNIIKNIFINHKIIIPMWDMSIGYGQDIITTLSYYVIGDPFALLSSIFPTKYAEIGYCFAIILRIYCSGITFSIYCRYRGHKNWYSLIGSLTYVFCHYALFSAIMHPYFMLPMVFLPILLVGIEKVFDGQGGITYIIGIALSALSNFYFFYMLAIVIIIYSLIRFFTLSNSHTFSVFFRLVIRFTLLTAIGLSISAVILLPTIVSIVTSSRIGTDNYISVLYPPIYYLQTLASFMSGGFGNYSFLGFTSLGLISVVTIFIHKESPQNQRALSAAFVILFSCFCLPFAGHIFNGFGYVTNRWCWALAMLVSYFIVIILPLMHRLTAEEWKRIAGTCLIIAVLPLLSHRVRNERTLLALVELLVTLAVFYVNARVRKSPPRFLAVFALTVFMLVGNAYYLFSPYEDNYIRNFANSGDAYKMLTKDSPTYMLNGVEDANTCRFDTSGIATGELKRNSSMLLNKNGIAFYFSTTNPAVSDFNRSLMLNYPMEHTYNNLDNRTPLQLLAGVKYLVTPSDLHDAFTKGISTRVSTNKEYSLYKMDYPLPIGFSTDKCILRSSFDENSVVDKERLLMEGVVIEDCDAKPGLNEHQIEKPIGQIRYKRESKEGASWNGNSWIVTKENASVEVRLDRSVSGMLYACIDGLRYEGINPYRLELDKEKLDRYERMINMNDSFAWDEPTSASIEFASAEMKNSITYFTWKNNYYAGKDSFVTNLGPSDEQRNVIRLTFNQPGIYSFRNLSFYEVSYDYLEPCIEELSRDHVESLTIGTNHISGNIDLNRPKYVCLQIPFSSGWKAVVDGHEAQLLKLDTMFVGLYLPAGAHSIELSYQTPMLKEGAIVTLLGVIFAILYYVIERKYVTRS